MRKNILILGHDDVTQFVDIYNQYTCLFDKKYYKVTVAFLTSNQERETKKRLLADETLFFNFPKKTLRGLKIVAIKQLLALMAKNKFALAICHRYKPSYLMMWVAKWHTLPIISVMHELDTMKSLRRQWLIALLARRRVLFAGVSNAVRDDIRNHLRFIPNERIVTLYNTMDKTITEPKFLSRETARSTLKLPPDVFVFGTLGRLVRNKDQTSLIQAFALIQTLRPQSRLIIMGTGELESSLKEEAAAYGLSHAITFTGFIDQGFRYMKAFDCFVLCSIQEAFGRVLLEAMLAKTPIIATSVHGIPEVITGVGTLVPQKDPKELAAAMLTLSGCTEKERERISENAYQHLLTHFSVESFAKQFWEMPFVQELGLANS